MVHFSAREAKAFSSSVLSAVALVITRMTGALTCPSKHISVHFCDLGFSSCALFCMVQMIFNCSALGVCIADKLLIYMS